MGNSCFKSTEEVYELKDIKQLPAVHRSTYDQFDHHVYHSDSSDARENIPYVAHVTDFADDSFADDSSSSSSSNYFEQ